MACNGTRPMYEPLCDYLPRMHIVSIRRWRNAFYFLPLLILDVFSPLFNELPFQKKKWNPAFAIILKKIVCNLAKFCHALYEITCSYWLGVVIDRMFSSAKLFGWTSMVPFFPNDFFLQKTLFFTCTYYLLLEVPWDTPGPSFLTIFFVWIGGVQFGKQNFQFGQNHKSSVRSVTKLVGRTYFQS